MYTDAVGQAFASDVHPPHQRVRSSPRCSSRTQVPVAEGRGVGTNHVPVRAVVPATH